MKIDDLPWKEASPTHWCTEWVKDKDGEDFTVHRFGRHPKAIRDKITPFNIYYRHQLNRFPKALDALTLQAILYELMDHT
jgi:hypothetical protein